MTIESFNERLHDGIIDGKILSSILRSTIREGVEESDHTPHLAAIIVGDDPASKMYVKFKEKACAQVGMRSSVSTLSSNTSNDELSDFLEKLNGDPDINGILLQLPLPDHLDEQSTLLKISASKDVDGLHYENVGKLHLGLTGFVPCTPSGIMQMLSYSQTPLAGANAVVVGRSNLVGKPIARLLEKQNATVTLCHSRTKRLADVTKRANIVIAAAGRKDLITEDMVGEDSVVIDVGTNSVNGKLYGDVDFENVRSRTKLITPVPGGVGPMTITMLLQNTLDAYRLQNSSKST